MTPPRTPRPMPDRPAKATLPPPAVEITALNKCLDGRVLLSDLSLTIRTGCCTGLLGRNGAGKTSLLRCILNLLAIDTGQIRIFGTTHVQCRARKALAYLPEGFAPPDWLSGRAFLEMQGHLYGVGGNAEHEGRTLEMLDLNPVHLQRRIGDYSRGMVQKLGLASCLLSQRHLLLLDEPVSGLDPLARRGLQHCLREATAEGRTVLLATHMLADIDQFCQQIAVLDAGRLRYADNPHAFRSSFAAQDTETAYLACTAPIGRH